MSNYPIQENPTLTDQSLIWDTANATWKRSPLQKILDLFNASLTSSAGNVLEPETLYAAPDTAGFDVQITDSNLDVHLILVPVTTLSSGAITLPYYTNLRDKQVLIVSCTQQITTFTVNLNGATAAHGAPTSLGADDYFTLKYDVNTNSWYRIG